MLLWGRQLTFPGKTKVKVWRNRTTESLIIKHQMIITRMSGDSFVLYDFILHLSKFHLTSYSNVKNTKENKNTPWLKTAPVCVNADIINTLDIICCTHRCLAETFIKDEMNWVWFWLFREKQQGESALQHSSYSDDFSVLVEVSDVGSHLIFLCCTASCSSSVPDSLFPPSGY